MRIDIVDIWFEIVNGHISSNFVGVVCPYFRWVNVKACIDSKEIWFGIANGQISSNLDSYLPTTR